MLAQVGDEVDFVVISLDKTFQLWFPGNGARKSLDVGVDGRNFLCILSAFSGNGARKTLAEGGIDESVLLPQLRQQALLIP